MEYTDYTDGAAAPMALAATQATELTRRQIVERGPFWAVLADGTVLDWSQYADRPIRRRGTVELTSPDSFAQHAAANATADTLLWGDPRSGRLVAVMNDHPTTKLRLSRVLDYGTAEDLPANEMDAGRRDDLVVLQLAETDDWKLLAGAHDKMLTQAVFAELIEDLAHTVTEPDGATMSEIARTLQMRKTIDVSSRSNVGGGDLAFNLTEETTTRAGRGPSAIEIPTTVTFVLPVWSDTAPVAVVARLRVREVHGQPCLGLRLMRRDAVLRESYDAVVAAVQGGLPEFVPPVLIGDPMVSRALLVAR